ncbi:MAG: PH domain-containing protein [Dermatophilaceae bacterium]
MSGTDPEADETWRRLSPRMLLVHPVRELGRYIPALLGLVVAGRSVGDGELWWLGPLGVVVVIALSVLRWATTRYRITPEQVQLRTGLLQRKTVATPADRVRSVDVTASPLHRLLGLAKVDIGTGSHDIGSGLSLDSLPAAEAAALRAELLHRSPAALGPEPQEGAVANGDDIELARLDPRWVRFAPFTMSGVLGAAAILGVGWNLLDRLDVTPTDVGPVRGVIDHLERTVIWLDILQGLLALAALVTILAIGGYVLSYWGFRLTRHAQGTLHITRGLLTTRATSIEERRLRGVELAEPLLLRAVHAARLSGITTGLKSRGGADGGSSLLLPPAPRAVARDVAAQILRNAAPLDVSLTAHGPAARRRRFVRALLPPLLLVAGAGVAMWSGGPAWLLVVAVMTVPFAVLLAADRYRSLGHALSGGTLVTQQGSLDRRRDVLECEGVIGWNLRESFFQRRAGLATLTATTAAGRQQYAVTDLPLSQAVSLGNRVLPGLLGEFLTDKPRDGARPEPTNLGIVHDPEPANLDPAGQPHPDLPLGVWNDLSGVDRVEVDEEGDADDHEDSGRQEADLASSRGGLGTADTEPEHVGHREHEERHERDRVEAEDGPVLVVEPRQVPAREARQDRTSAPVAAESPHEQQDEDRQRRAPPQGWGPD